MVRIKFHQQTGDAMDVNIADVKCYCLVQDTQKILALSLAQDTCCGLKFALERGSVNNAKGQPSPQFRLKGCLSEPALSTPPHQYL